MSVWMNVIISWALSYGPVTVPSTLHADKVEGPLGTWAFIAVQTTKTGNPLSFLTTPHSSVHGSGGQRESQRCEKELFSLSIYLSSSASMPLIPLQISPLGSCWDCDRNKEHLPACPPPNTHIYSHLGSGTPTITMLWVLQSRSKLPQSLHREALGILFLYSHQCFIALHFTKATQVSKFFSLWLDIICLSASLNFTPSTSLPPQTIFSLKSWSWRTWTTFTHHSTFSFLHLCVPETHDTHS